MNTRGIFASVFLGALAGAWLTGAMAAGDSPEAPAEFAEAYLNDPANIAAGKVVWEEQCRHCHGKLSYPGKAPKLEPKRYNADFVFSWVTYGYGNMPAWQEVYTREERMNVVTYVLSKNFSP